MLWMLLHSQGARNLSENLLPQVSDSFIRAGQYGSSQMGEMGSRALRDTQEAILKAQAPIAAQGYEGALRASAADKQRQAGLAGTVGSISGADLSRMLTGAGQFSALGTAAGQMTGADAGRALTAGSTLGQMTGSDAARIKESDTCGSKFSLKLRAPCCAITSITFCLIGVHIIRNITN